MQEATTVQWRGARNLSEARFSICTWARYCSVQCWEDEMGHKEMVPEVRWRPSKCHSLPHGHSLLFSQKPCTRESCLFWEARHPRWPDGEKK